MPYLEEALTAKIIECVIKVHQVLGPGFLESIYRKALVLELRRAGLHVEFEKEVLVFYLKQQIGKHRLDLLIEKKIVAELKNVDFYIQDITHKSNPIYEQPDAMLDC